MGKILSFLGDNSIAALIAGLFGLAACVGGLVVAYIGIYQNTAPIKLIIEATQTAEAKLTSEVLLVAAPTATPILPTNTRVLEGLKDTSTGEPIDTPITTKVPKSPTSTPTPAPTNTPRLTSTPMPSPTATQISPGTILFEEDFEDGKAQLFSQWGNWVIVEDNTGNRVYEVDNTKGSQYPGMNFGSEEWKDYSVEYRFKLLELGGHAPAIALEFRRSTDDSDASTAYVQSFLANYGSALLVYTSPNSGWQDLKEQPFNVASGNWYSVRVEVQGTQIRVFVDDYFILDVIDSRLEKGSLSLQVGPGVHAQFDDVRVVALGE